MERAGKSIPPVLFDAGVAEASECPQYLPPHRPVLGFRFHSCDPYMRLLARFRNWIWRLLTAAGKLLVALATLITLTTGWGPFWHLLRGSGVMDFTGHLWFALVAWIGANWLLFVLCCAEVLTLACLSYLLVDKARRESRAEFEARRREIAKKRKKGKP